MEIELTSILKSSHLPLYTCQLFVRYKRETSLLGVRGISEEDTIISEDFRRSMKSSEGVRSLPKTSEVLGRV